MDLKLKTKNDYIIQVVRSSADLCSTCRRMEHGNRYTLTVFNPVNLKTTTQEICQKCKQALEVFYQVFYETN